ncbi:MAG: UDP-N-acetylmuramoyl-L-alanine--D-glutamate ligase [Alphaproteobacteria bacterium]
MSEIKAFVNSLGGKPILIYGLGKSGLSTLKAFIGGGATVVVGDDDPTNVAQAKELGAQGLDDTSLSFSDYAFLVLSPGVPLTHPQPHDVVKQAQAANLEILCDIELFSRIYPDQKIIGVTGTNGKSTTVTLIMHILNTCGQKALLGGNIGTPVFDLDLDGADTMVILEMSSFQIDLCPVFRPDISVILNLTPDHLDRHGSMDHYMEVKERLGELGRHNEPQSVIIATDDMYTQKILDRARDLALRDIVQVSTSSYIEDGICEKDGFLYDHGAKVGDLSSLTSLKGIHNYQNAACSYAVARQCGFEFAEVWDAMQSFAGLNHRQFLVRTVNGVTYINDSKSTNAAAAAVALGCRNNVYWIVGGRKKKTGLDGLEEFFPRIKHAFLIGEAMDDFAGWFDKYGIEYTKSITLDRAVDGAHKMAQDNRGQPGGAGVVLLSPACASFDQFKNFEDRGDKFTDLIHALDGSI